MLRKKFPSFVINVPSYIKSMLQLESTNNFFCEGAVMAKKKKSSDIDFAALQEKIQRQFRNLDPNDPSVWPALPKALLYTVVAIAGVRRQKRGEHVW